MPRSDPGPLTATVHQEVGWRPALMNTTPHTTGNRPAADSALRMAAEWYIDNSGQVEGPISEAEIRDRAAGGLLRPTDSVSTDRVKWMPASSIAGIAFPPRQPLTETVVSGSFPTTDPAITESLSPLDSLPGYELEPGTSPLGIGACGVVYKARQVKLDRVVALKTVLMSAKASPEVIARFEQEAVSLAKLQHPNIVAVYDCGHSRGRAYFAMELLDGEDLAARLKRNGAVDEQTAWLVARQTAAALAHAARHGVIHRDIKPANLFLVPPPTGFSLPPGVPMVKVTDFGLALTQSAAESGDQRQTAAGVLLGTPVYMAPEQFTGSTVDPRADIYSLGATLYHVLSGEAPFDGRSVWEVMMRKSAPPPRLGPTVSPATADLVAEMMAADPKDRPADYATLIARIDALPCLEGAGSPSGMISVSGRMSAPNVVLPDAPVVCPLPRPAARHPRWLYAVAALALIGTGVGIARLAGLFNRPPADHAEPDSKGGGPPNPVRPPADSPRGAEALFDGKSVIGWIGPGLEIEKDEEHKPVLTIESSATHALKAKPNFRVVLALDCSKTGTAEVVIATADSPAEAQWLVRVDPKVGVAFGKRVKGGAFEPVAPPVPFPAPKRNQPPYLELRYERSGGALAAWFDNKPLGRTPDAGLKTGEVRVEATGGPVRIESAEFTQLADKR